MKVEQIDILPKKSLRHRVLHAGVWTLAGHVASQILRFGSNLIMTRLLVPEMFGIMVIANVVQVGLQMFTDLGLRQNIVQSHRNDLAFLNTIWSVQIIRASLIFAVALGAAFVIYLLGLAHWLPTSSVYAEPALPGIMAVLSITALISGFETTKYGTAARNMALGKLTQIDLICQAAGIALMISWALVVRSIWSLVIGSILTGLLRVILGNALLPGERNRFHWNMNIVREIFGFGKWIFGTSILGFLAANGDRLILGGLIDAKTLGLYSIALFMVIAMREVFAKLIANVSFPALSEVVRERPLMLKQAYYKFRYPLDIVALFSTGLLFYSGHFLIDIFYDHRYSSSGHMLEILCIMLFEVRFTVAAQCFMALGKPKLMIPGSVIQVIALYGLMPLAFAWYGFNGALWVAAGSVLLTLPMIIYLKIKLGLFDIKNELRVLPWLMFGLAIGWGLNQAAIILGLGMSK